MNTPIAKINVSDYTQVASTPGGLIAYVSGVTRRGPVGDPSQIFDTYEKFKRVFGEDPDQSLFEGMDGSGSSGWGQINIGNTVSKFNLYVKRLFSYGYRLRVNRIIHDFQDGEMEQYKPSAPNPLETQITSDLLEGTSLPLFKASIKYPGADYNGIKITMSKASNGSSKAFNMNIDWPAYPEYSESYQNIPMPDFTKPKWEQTYLDNVMKLTQLVTFEYLDTKASLPSDFSVPTTQEEWDMFYKSLKISFKRNSKEYDVFTGGSDGGPVSSLDFAKGVDAFDQVQDGPCILAIPGVTDLEAQAAYKSKAEMRKDMIYMGSVSVTTDNVDSIIESKDTIIGDTPYSVISGGGIKILDPKTGRAMVISEIADVMGLVAVTYNQRGAWFDPASQQSAKILDAIGVGVNFGTPALSNKLNDLSNHGINMLVVDEGGIEWKSSYTSQLADSAMSFMSVVMLVLYMKATLLPVLKRHLKEPCDIPTFQSIYRQSKTFLDGLTSKQSRALWKYEYLGDQDAQSLDDLTVNTKEDVQIGKYKAYLKLWVIVPMVEAVINMALVMGDGEVGIEITQ